MKRSFMRQINELCGKTSELYSLLIGIINADRTFHENGAYRQFRDIMWKRGRKIKKDSAARTIWNIGVENEIPRSLLFVIPRVGPISAETLKALANAVLYDCSDEDFVVPRDYIYDEFVQRFQSAGIGTTELLCEDMFEAQITTDEQQRYYCLKIKPMEVKL